MKTSHYKHFVHLAQERTQMRSIKNNLHHNIGKYHEALPKGKLQFTDLEQVRQTANERKKMAIENLYSHLITFERNSIMNGCKVLWASDADDALSYIKEIAIEKKATTVVKSKSMVSEEIHLNAFLEQMGIAAIETDLGEFIQQLDGEPPIHILTPAMHKSKENVADLFHQKLQTEPNLSPYELTKIARQVLRKKYLQAEIGITGANFILPDIGGIAITENEGNARLTTAFPKTHIVIVGIEKVLPATEDLNLFWPLLSTYGTGQNITSYSTIITGPKNLYEHNGPDDMYVILLDNGRTNILADPIKRESLYCIRCGSCLNACPVYKNLAGGHGYDTTYSGPIGSVISPHLKGMEHFAHLSFASSLCGACTATCPVKINLHELLLSNRKEAVQKKMFSETETIKWKMWSILMKHQWLFNRVNGRLKTFFVNYVIAPNWRKKRSMLEFPQHSFKQLYQQYKRERRITY